MHDDPVELLLTGTAAVGKTAVAAEIGEMLAASARSIVIVDLDPLGAAFIPDAPRERILKLRTDNLAAIWPNLCEAELSHVLISAAISTVEELQQVHDAVGPSQVTVVRLVTPPALLDARLRGRDTGRLLEDHLAIMPALRRSMDESRLEEFRVVNDERSPRDVATEVLEQIGWI